MPFVYKPPSELDKEKLYQLTQQREQELITLKRQYDIFDRERTGHVLAGFPKLNKTSRVISIAENEYKNILANLAVATGPEKLRKDRIQFEHLTELLHHYGNGGELIEKKKMYLRELDDQIRQTSRSLISLKEKASNHRQNEALTHAARKTVQTLENSLDTQMKKFNLIMTKNIQLRGNIEYLLWDRQNFMSIWNKLIDKVNSGKRIMLDLIEQASIAYDQREDWCNKLQMLRITGHRDFMLNSDQMRIYNHAIANAIKLKEFYVTKGQKRILMDLYHKETLKRMEQKKKIAAKLVSYGDMLNEIEAFTRQTEVEIIARDYYTRESDNFSKFQYIIEVIGKLELVNDQLTFLNIDIDEQRKLHQERVKQQATTLLQFERELEEQKKITQNTEKELEDIDSHLNQLMQGVSTLFQICKCSKDPLLQLLGDNTTIQSYNVLLYLQILEETIQELLIRAAYKRHLMLAKNLHSHVFTLEKLTSKIHGIEKIVMDHPCSLCAEYEMVADVFDVSIRPWSKEEVHQRLKHRLQLPHGDAIVHRISKCHLPKARRVIQQRYM